MKMSIKNYLKDHAIPVESLALLAHAYTKSGDFVKSYWTLSYHLRENKREEEKRVYLK